MRLRSSAFVLVVLAIAVAGVVLAFTAPVGLPTSMTGVAPRRVDVATAGDVTCGGLGAPFGSDVLEVVDGRVVGTPPSGVALTVDPGGRSAAWAAAFPLAAVVVGSGGQLHVYAYEPARTRDAGLSAPRDGGGMPVRIDRLLACWGAEGVEVAWCPPEFWAEPAHLAEWTVAGVDPDERFSARFGTEPPRSEAARALGAPLSPTLQQVVVAPRWYGADTAVLVADLLSELHPAVTFVGSRPAGTCPL